MNKPARQSIPCVITFRASGFLASAAKDDSAHPITQAFDLCRIGGIPEALGEVEEFLLLALFSLDSALDKFQQQPVGAKPARFRQWCDAGLRVKRSASVRLIAMRT